MFYLCRHLSPPPESDSLPLSRPDYKEIDHDLAETKLSRLTLSRTPVTSGCHIVSTLLLRTPHHAPSSSALRDSPLLLTFCAAGVTTSLRDTTASGTISAAISKLGCQRTCLIMRVCTQLQALHWGNWPLAESCGSLKFLATSILHSSNNLKFLKYSNKG